MIERYNLNLGKSFCCSASMRRKYYFWMILYLFLAGGVLIDGAYQIAARLSYIRNAGSLSSDLRGDFSRKHDGVESAEDYVQVLERRLEDQEAKLTALFAQARGSIPFLPVLFEVQKTLPKSVVLSGFQMSTIQLDLKLYFPVGGESPENYLQQWRANVALSRYLETLEVVSRVNGVDFGGDKMVELSCVADLKKR